MAKEIHSCIFNITIIRKKKNGPKRARIGLVKQINSLSPPGANGLFNWLNWETEDWTKFEIGWEWHCRRFAGISAWTQHFYWSKKLSWDFLFLDDSMYWKVFPHCCWEKQLRKNWKKIIFLKDCNRKVNNRGKGLKRKEKSFTYPSGKWWHGSGEKGDRYFRVTPNWTTYCPECSTGPASTRRRPGIRRAPTLATRHNCRPERRLSYSHHLSVMKSLPHAVDRWLWCRLLCTAAYRSIRRSGRRNETAAAAAVAGSRSGRVKTAPSRGNHVERSSRWWEYETTAAIRQLQWHEPQRPRRRAASNCSVTLTSLAGRSLRQEKNSSHAFISKHQISHSNSIDVFKRCLMYLSRLFKEMYGDGIKRKHVPSTYFMSFPMHLSV